jgi:hypothetical protein
MPFLHFLAEENDGLVCVKEAVTAFSGDFFAPLKNGELYHSYDFHFKIYLGQGNFVEELFTGIAQKSSPNSLVLSFGEKTEGVTIELHTSPEILKYKGNISHPDFDDLFVKLYEPSFSFFDELLEKYGISVVGFFNYAD